MPLPIYVGAAFFFSQTVRKFEFDLIKVGGVTGRRRSEERGRGEAFRKI